MQTTARNASLEDLATLLKEQQARKIDVVAPARSLWFAGGELQIVGADQLIELDGVTNPNGWYRPTAIFDDGVSEKLGIHRSYLRRLRDNRPDLYDANVNGWLHGGTAGFADGTAKGMPGDSRSFLLRCFRGDNGPGIARAFLSNSFKIMDNLDVLMSVLDGVREAGVNVTIDQCNLTERHMRVRVASPEVRVMAENLLKGYRNPFAGTELDRWRRIAAAEGMGYGGEEPVVFAGFVFGNSETGDGAFSITPVAIIQVCANGLTIKRDMMREVHLGGRLEDGVVQYSHETQVKAVELVKAKTADAVRTFLSTDYLAGVVESLEEKADKPVEVKDVQTIGKKLSFTEDQMQGILSHFIRGGQTTAGGVMQAVSSFAQVVEDADEAAKLEDSAVAVLDVA